MILKILIIPVFAVFAILISINMLKIIQIRLKYGTFNIIKLLRITSDEDNKKIRGYYKNVLLLTILFIVLVTIIFFVNSRLK